MWAGPKHCIALTSPCNNLVMWGEHDSKETNEAPSDAPYRQINLRPVRVAGIDTEGEVAVSCGFDHTLITTKAAAPDTHGKLYVWGRNSQGQLGLPKQTDKVKVAVEPLELTVSGNGI